MCELKNETPKNSEADKTKLTTATVEGSNVIAGQPELSKGTEYFDFALEQTGFGKFNYLLILLSGVILSNVVLETLSIGFVLPVSHCDLHLTVAERGVLSAIGFAGIISSSHLLGFLADTRGRKKIIMPTLLLGFIMTIISSFSTNFWTLLILRYLNGICISGGSATIYAYLGEFHTQKYRSRAIMGSAIIFAVGGMILPGLAWLVINNEWRWSLPVLDLTYKPWRLFMVVCGIPGFLCGLCLLKMPESPKYLLSQGQEDECLEVLRQVYHSNTGRNKDSFPVSRVAEDLDSYTQNLRHQSISSENAVISMLRSMWSQTQPLFNKDYVTRTCLICTIQFWIFVTSNGMYMWFPYILNSVAEYTHSSNQNSTYLCDVIYQKQQEDFNSPESLSAEICNETLDISTYTKAFILELCYGVGFAFFCVIINKVSKKVILFLTLAICGVCGILAPLTQMLNIALYLYIILLSCGLGANVLSATTVDLYPTRLNAMAVCISLMAGRLGSVIGSNIVSAMLSQNCEITFISSGVSLILAGLMGFLIPAPSKDRLPFERPRRDSLVSITRN